MDRLDSLLDIIDQGEDRYGDRFAFWDARRRRVGRALDLPRAEPAQPDHRLAASGARAGVRRSAAGLGSFEPAVPALYFGAMRAGRHHRAARLRMSSGAIERIVARADARHLVLGTGRDTPDPADARLEHFPSSVAEQLAAEPDATSRPTGGAGQRLAAPRPRDLAEVIFTSGTPASRKA